MKFRNTRILLRIVSPFSGSECSFTVGDGGGGSEVELGAPTGEQCVNACMERKKTDATINGVTVRNDNSPGCWCEQNMNNIDVANTVYKTCYLSGELFVLGHVKKNTCFW